MTERSYSETLRQLAATGNLRVIPDEQPAGLVDLSSNDYLGFGEDSALREAFFAGHAPADLLMSASASRLLGARQKAFADFEKLLSESYGGRAALLFNSGYHANTGIVSALADKKTLIVADKLVHASIIDGMKLSGAPFERFRHNDTAHLQRILQAKAKDYDRVLIIVESVYSMDGDRADLETIADIKSQYPGAMLYVDEAHAVGVEGPGGLGLAAARGVLDRVDVLIGTLGKALASTGAFAVTSTTLREYLVNKVRSLIFSTALPPATVMWSDFVWRHSLGADTARERLKRLSAGLAEIIPGGEPSHIRPLIIGDARRTLEASQRLLAAGYKVLPIRVPTVPPGTERLRFSLSAALDIDDLKPLHELI